MRKPMITGGASAPSSANNMTAVQKFNNEQIMTKGFRFTSSAGTKQSFPIQLGGEARFLYGITVYSADLTDNISLEINNEKIIDNVSVNAYTPYVNMYKETQYYATPRVLSGSDTVNFTIDAQTSHTVDIVFYIRTNR